MQERKDTQEHFRADILVQFNVVVVVDPLFIAEAALDKQLDFLVGLDAVHERVAIKQSS